MDGGASAQKLFSLSPDESGSNESNSAPDSAEEPESADPSLRCSSSPTMSISSISRGKAECCEVSNSLERVIVTLAMIENEEEINQLKLAVRKNQRSRVHA